MQSIKPFIKELRLVEMIDWVSYLHFGQHHQIGDLIDSASEQYFAPEFLAYREKGQAVVDWSSPLSIKLWLVMNTPEEIFEFSLMLGQKIVSIHCNLNDLEFHKPHNRTALQILSRALEVNKIAA